MQGINFIYSVCIVLLAPTHSIEAPKRSSSIHRVFSRLQNKSALSEKINAANPLQQPTRSLGQQPKAHRAIRELAVQLDTETAVIFTWAVIQTKISENVIYHLWLESNITETLDTTAIKRSNIFKAYGDRSIITTNGSSFQCPVTATELTYETMSFPSTIPGYKGEFGILSDRITTELFYYIANIIQKEPALHTIMYALRDYTVYSTLTFIDGNYQIACYITKDFIFFIILRYTQETGDNPYVLSWLLGKPDRMPVLKGSLNYNDITVAANSKYALSILASGDTIAHVLNYLEPRYATMFATLVNSDPMQLITRLQNKFLRLQAEGNCHLPLLNFEFLELTFQTLGVHFLLGQGLQEQLYSDVQCLSKLLCELQALRNLFQTCYPQFYIHGFQSTTLATIAASQIMNVPIDKLPKLSFESQESILHLLQVSTAFSPSTEKALAIIATLALEIYNAYVESFTLTPQNRKLILETHIILLELCKKTRAYNNYNLMLTYVLMTSMCSTLEMAELIQIMSSTDQIFYNETFSPCYTSLRFDVNKDKLYSSSYQSSDLTLADKQMGVNSFYNVLHEEHITFLYQVQGVKCLDTNHSLILAIPLRNVTYFLSKTPIEKAKNYAVTEVYLNSKMYISAVLPNCSLFPDSDSVHNIPIIYNVSNPKHECIFCDMILINYDEQGGFQSMMYITSKHVQDKLFLSNSPFFDSNNLHIHYLLLSNNGTVIEIRGRYREQVLSVVIFFLFIISFAAGIFSVYKLAVYCC